MSNAEMIRVLLLFYYWLCNCGFHKRSLAKFYNLPNGSEPTLNCRYVIRACTGNSSLCIRRSMWKRNVSGYSNKYQIYLRYELEGSEGNKRLIVPVLRNKITTCISLCNSFYTYINFYVSPLYRKVINRYTIPTIGQQ